MVVEAEQKGKITEMGGVDRDRRGGNRWGVMRDEWQMLPPVSKCLRAR